MILSRTDVVFGIVLATLFCTIANALPSTHAIHEKRDRILSEWRSVGQPKPDSLLRVRIGLKQNNLHLANEYLLDV
jgi:tripeptidyl-peptidase-1